MSRRNPGESNLQSLPAERRPCHPSHLSFRPKRTISKFVPMCSTPFEITVSVKPEDIDEQNHVNNTVYLRWVQEVATAHWQAIASSEERERIGWVVLRHEIDYNAPACLG